MPGFNQFVALKEQRWGRSLDFQNLMATRVDNILLVSSLYDTFILQEDGKLNELILNEFLGLNLQHTTGLMHVSTGSEAIRLAEDNPTRYSLILTAVNAGDMEASQLAAHVASRGLPIPVVLLAYDGGELNDFISRSDVSAIEKMFLWQGDADILLAIVKYMEDKANVAHDVGEAGVQLILVIEDNIRYYSAFLPTMYREVIQHSQRVISEGYNVADKILRMRARPKIALCSTWEEAWSYFERFPEQVMGVISDIEFPREGRLDPEAGVEFALTAKRIWPDIAVILQTSNPNHRAQARAVGADFLLKGSPTLLSDLRRIIRDRFFFGPFTFRLRNGTEVARAQDLGSLLAKMRTVPVDSVTYHAERNHFSRWLKARTEFALAAKLRPMLCEHFTTPEEMRTELVRIIEEHRVEQYGGVVADFDRARFDAAKSFARIGRGSLGGKARALAFMRYLIREYGLDLHHPDVSVVVPPSVVLGTDVFDAFLEKNNLAAFALESEDDEEIVRRFQLAELPEDIMRDLASYLELIRYPLAVRSSSLLEDSQYQPLAGVYKTIMLPNNHVSSAVRLRHLVSAVKRVYASTFSQFAKAYFSATQYRLEEEKMAVLIQQIVGAQHEDRFYPDFAGVARSLNFYPHPPTKAEDGVVSVALGLGRMVVDGEASLSFSPAFPQHIVQFSSVKDMLDNSQREFLAIKLGSRRSRVRQGEDSREERFTLDVAEADNTLSRLASTYSPDDHAVHEGIARPGVRLVTFGPLLKHRLFPLTEILKSVLELGAGGMNNPVEIEFAVNLATPPGDPQEFGFLQVRPLAHVRQVEEVELGAAALRDILVRSSSVLGNGVTADLHDLVVIDRDRFDRSKTAEMAHELGRLNRTLVAAGIRYALIGLGRWGSADPWLGIPVNWQQISNARVIVECGLPDMKVTPSQGSHFFQNLTSFRIGYFTVNTDTEAPGLLTADAATRDANGERRDEGAGDGGRSDGHAGDGDATDRDTGADFVAWKWLREQSAVSEGTYFRHLRFESPLVVKMDGRSQRGLILKPGS
jgi:hypothetical protein